MFWWKEQRKREKVSPVRPAARDILYVSFRHRVTGKGRRKQVLVLTTPDIIGVISTRGFILVSWDCLRIGLDWTGLDLIKF